MNILSKRSVVVLLAIGLALASVLDVLARDGGQDDSNMQVVATTPMPLPSSTPQPPPSPAPLPSPTLPPLPVAETEEEEGPRPLVLVESGYRLNWIFDSYFLTHSYVLYNPNEDFGLRFSTIRITAHAADGRMLGSRESILGQIRPGETVSIAGEAFLVEEAPTSVEFEAIAPQPGNWVYAREMILLDDAALTLANISVADAGMGWDDTRWRRITGEIVNESEHTVSNGAIMLLFRDENGELIGGYNTPFFNLEANNRRPFDISISGNLWSENHELHVHPW